MRGRYCAFGALLWLIVGSAAADSSQITTLATPAELYGELFQRVQLERVYPDGKTFVDAVPRTTPAQILEQYHQSRTLPRFDLKRFVTERFEVPPPPNVQFETARGSDVREHIDRLWNVLTRAPGAQPMYSSRLALPHRYVVPGGRFSEVYY